MKRLWASGSRPMGEEQKLTGVDFVAEMAAPAKENCSKRGADISALVQDISALEVPHGSYDMIWLSANCTRQSPQRQDAY